ncbi:MAG: FKBP-type peptidyl-prolyl cis-trans isomerase SlyD [Pseudomonadota bacterium]
MKIQNNCVAAFTYLLKDADSGEILDESGGRPLEFIVGKGNIIPGLESQMIGMQIGDQAILKVAPQDAYGVYDESGVQELPAEQFMGLELSENMPLYGQAEDGSTVQVVVKSFNSEIVTIDHNHPLAGKTLSFEVEIANVREATPEEILSGSIACDNSQGGDGHCGSCGCGH